MDDDSIGNIRNVVIQLASLREFVLQNRACRNWLRKLIHQSRYKVTIELTSTRDMKMLCKMALRRHNIQTQYSRQNTAVAENLSAQVDKICRAVSDAVCSNTTCGIV